MYVMEPDLHPEEKTPGKFENLHRVTPLSNYLAMVLFIALPFIGGWFGYTLALESVVEVEKIVIAEPVKTGSEKSTDDSVENNFETDSISINMENVFNATRTIPFDLGKYPTTSLNKRIQLEVDHSGTAVLTTFSLPSNWIYLNDSRGFSPSRYSFSSLKPDIFISSNYAEEWPTERCMGGCDGTPWVLNGIRLEYQFRELENSSIEVVTNREDCKDESCRILDSNENSLVILNSLNTTAKTIDDGGRTYVDLLIYQEVNGSLGRHRFHFNPSDQYGIDEAWQIAESLYDSLSFSRN